MRRLALLGSFALLAAIALGSTRAHATPFDKSADDDETDPFGRKVTMGLSLRRGSFDLPVGGHTFSGDGTGPSGHFESVHASAASLGVLRPHVNMYDVALDLGVDPWYGAMVFGFGKTSADASPKPGAPTNVFDVNDLRVFRLGLETGGSLWIGGHLRLTIGGILGFTSVSSDLAGYTTLYKGRTKQASASVVLPWIQPKLAFEVLLGDHLGVGVGGYVAGDVVHPSVVETGLTFSLRGVGPAF